MTVPTFSPPPHPASVLRYLHTSRRNYAASGGAGGADIPSFAGQPAASPMNVSGTVYVAPGVHMAATVSVGLRQTTLKGAQTANVDQKTGAFSTTIPGGSGAAGACTVEVSCTTPVTFTTNSNSITLT